MAWSDEIAENTGHGGRDKDNTSVECKTAWVQFCCLCLSLCPVFCEVLCVLCPWKLLRSQKILASLNWTAQCKQTQSVLEETALQKIISGSQQADASLWRNSIAKIQIRKPTSWRCSRYMSRCVHPAALREMQCTLGYQGSVAAPHVWQQRKGRHLNERKVA